MNGTDLTQRPPRSARVRLGGYVVLARILDKCRAAISGKQGEYKFNCPLDQRFFEFTGVDAEAFKQQAAGGRGDGEMLEWVNANSKHQRSPSEIEAWSCGQIHRVPGDIESREFFHGIHKEVAPHREDIVTWFDLLDLDDYASYGGKP
jgi:hypothetical protein